MTDIDIDNTAAPEAEETPTEPEAPETTEQSAGDDVAKLRTVVQKERASAKAARAAAEKAEGRLAELEAAELRRGVAGEKGLNAEQAAFLTGETPEEMTASADALLAAFGESGPSALLRRPREMALRTGATGLTKPAEDMSKVAERVLD